MDKCISFEGRPLAYQDEALGRWMHVRQLAVGQFAHAEPACETPLCLNVDHLRIVTPTRIEYPRGVCTYCGLSATTLDHLVPRAWTGDGARRTTFTVPACRECNSAIGAAWAPSVTERRAIARRFIAKKYAHVLRRREYDDVELLEFGPGLRQSVVEGLEEKRITEERLTWPPYGYDERAAELSGFDAYETGLVRFS